MPKTYYKVVTPAMQSICSNFKNHRAKNMAIQYRLYKWISPKFEVSALFVFDSLLDARSFAKKETSVSQGNTELDIYECHIRNRRRYIPLFNDPGDKCLLRKLQELVKAKKSLRHFMTFNTRGHIPPGTVCANNVKLTKLICKYSYGSIIYDDQQDQ